MEGLRIAAATTTIVVVFLGFLTSSGEYWQFSFTERGTKTEYMPASKFLSTCFPTQTNYFWRKILHGIMLSQVHERYSTLPDTRMDETTVNFRRAEPYPIENNYNIIIIIIIIITL